MLNGVEQGVTKGRPSILAAKRAIGIKQQPTFVLARVSLLIAFLQTFQNPAA